MNRAAKEMNTFQGFFKVICLFLTFVSSGVVFCGLIYILFFDGFSLDVLVYSFSLPIGIFLFVWFFYFFIFGFDDTKT